MVDAGPPPRRQPPDTAFLPRPLHRQEGQSRLGVPPGADLFQRHHHPALIEHRQSPGRSAGKALLGGNADLPHGIGRLHRQAEQLLFGGVLQLDPGLAGGTVGPGGLHLVAAVLHPAADLFQPGHLLVDHIQLAAEHGQAAVQVVVLHMVFDLLQRKADLLHDQDGVQVIQLAGAVVAVAVGRVHPGGAEHPRLVVKDQGLLGDVLILRHLADGEQVVFLFHAAPP